MKHIINVLTAGFLAFYTMTANALIANVVDFEDVPGIALGSHMDFGQEGFYSHGFHFTPGPQNIIVNQDTNPHGNVTVANDPQPQPVDDIYTWVYPNNSGVENPSQIAYTDFDIVMELGTPPLFLATNDCVECYQSPVSFSITSVDVAGILLQSSVSPNPYAGVYEPLVTVTGTYLGGGTVMTTITQDGVVDGPGGSADFLNYVFDEGWTGLEQVIFSVSLTGPYLDHFKGFLALDNIGYDVSYVPEPSTWLLFGIGLMALVGVNRRRLS